MNTPKTLAKIGSVYIEEAILAVLEGEEGLLPQEISERLDIPTDTDGILRLTNAVVLGFLTKLKIEGRVQDTDELPNVARRWSLPDARIRDAHHDNPQNALETLKRSVLQVLYEEHEYGKRRRLLRKEIGEQLGIDNVPLIEGLLWDLYEDGYVECTGNHRWCIIPEGVSVIDG